MFVLRQQSGSALLSTLLIVSSLGLVFAGIARFTTIEVRTSGALEDAALAFQAAEAGIEEGLLRWRFDHGIELPRQNMTQEILRGVRVNLSQASYEADADLTQLPSIGKDALYDLRIWYKAHQVGSPAELFRADYPYRIVKDQSIELDVSDLTDRFVAFTYHVPDGATYTARIETRVVTELPDGTLNELCCKLFSSASSGREIRIFLPETATGRGHRIRIKPYLFAASDGISPAPAESFITYALQPESASQALDSGITVIESTGYVGAARRTLVAKINRASGTILGVYDYAAFAGQGSVQGQ